MKNNYLSDAWLVLVLALFFGLGLAYVQATLTPRIDANKLNDALTQIPHLVEGSEQGKKVEKIEQVELAGTRVFKALDAAGATVGWVVPASGQGFADVVSVLIGVDANVTKITGLYVLDQKETPGLGDYITDGQKFRNQFVNKPADGSLTVVKHKAAAVTEVEAITGATISSDSVTGIINKRLLEFRQALAAPTAP